MKTYIVYIQRSGLEKPLVERIGMIGDHIFVETGLYLVKSEETAVEIEGKLSAPPYDNLEFFVAELKPEEGNIFGRLRNGAVWRFLGLWDDPKEEKAPEPPIIKK